MPDVPLFLTPDYYITLPLQMTYDLAFRGMPSICRVALETPPAA